MQATDPSNAGRGIGLLQAIRAALAISHERAERVFVVGGVVRDAVMGVSAGEHDLDIVVEGQGIDFARRLAEILECSVKVHQPFLTAKLTGPFCARTDRADVELSEIDIATTREEMYEKPGALPTVRPASIERDLWRRDFSTNAIALPLECYAQIREGLAHERAVLAAAIDPCSGIPDIKGSTLRILHPRSFIDDPTRLFRAVRYIVRLSFHFDMQTLAGFLEAVKSGVLASLSPRRVWNEVIVTFDEVSPSEVLQEFLQRGLFSHVAVISPNDPAWLFEALQRLEMLRPHLGSQMFVESGKVMLIAGLLREGREDIARAVHEGSRIIHRASAVLEASHDPTGLRTIPDVAAAYCIHCTSELKDFLQACLQGRGR